MSITDTYTRDEYVAGLSPELAAARERDQRLCACSHPCMSHGSFDNSGVYVGIGMAGCGNGTTDGCDCRRFTERVSA